MLRTHRANQKHAKEVDDDWSDEYASDDQDNCLQVTGYLIYWRHVERASLVVQLKGWCVSARD